MVKGKTATEVAELAKQELLEEIGIPLTPVRLKCALLGLATLKVALHKAKGTPLPEESPAWTSSSSSSGHHRRRPADELPPGSVKLVRRGPARRSASTTAAGEYYAIEDRCSHDDGPLCEGDWDPEECTVVCPRHGSNFDLATGRAAVAAGVPAGRDLPRARRGRNRQGRRRADAEALLGERATRSTSRTTTRSGAGRSPTSAASTSGSASRASSRGSPG